MLHYIKALLHLGQGAFDASIAEWELGLEQARNIQHRVLQGAMFSHLGIALRETGRGREAVDTLRRGAALDEQGGSLHGLAFALVNLGHTLLSSGDRAEARELLDRGNDVARRVQNPRCQAWAAWGRARLAFADGRPDLAVEECRRATALLQDREFPSALVQLWEFQAETATAAGRL